MLWKDKDGNLSKGWIILDVAHHSDDPEEDEPPRLMRVINPTEEQYRRAGYTPYEPPAPEPDPEYERRYQEYLTACEQFRTVCGLIKDFAGLDEFTGGFDEAMEFVQGEAFMANMVQGNYLFSLWQGADKAATYAASKIGIGQPEWWYDCWDQVEPEPEPTPEQEPEPEEEPASEPEEEPFENAEEPESEPTSEEPVNNEESPAEETPVEEEPEVDGEEDPAD